MVSQTIIAILFFSVLVPLVCGTTETKEIYDEFVTKIIDFERIKNKVMAKIRGKNIDESKLVALKMFDASTKIPNGLAVFNTFDLGNFDECYAIKYGEIYGKYCLGTLAPLTNPLLERLARNISLKPRMPMLHQQPRLIGLGDDFTGFHFAACVPSTMKASEIPGLLTYTEDFCYSKATEPELSAGTIATIVVLAVFLAIITVSTTYDVVLYYSKKEPTHELLIAFSFLSNGRKLFKSSTNPDQLLCLNGIKALSMMWVIIGHEYSNLVNAPISNALTAIEWSQNAANMFIMGATVSVDTFFVVGGLVTAYTYLKSVDRGVKFNIILYYVHRYLRLTPPLIIVSLTHLYLLNYLGNGPLWKVVDWTLVDLCRTGWWSTLLYITNYIQKGGCAPQTWYLSVDMQFFILSPLILIPLSRWPKIGLGSLGFLSIAGCVIPFVIGFTEHIGTVMSQGEEGVKFSTHYYIQTYARFGPYVVGMALGYLIYRVKHRGLKIRLQPSLVGTLWVVFLVGLTACVYANHNLNQTTVDRLSNSLFLAFNRPAWAVAVSGIIFLCVVGYGGPVDWFLSLPIFQFLTKVSYSMYLIHYPLIIMRISAMKNNFRFSDLAVIHIFWGDFMFTLFLSLILCLSFESPIIILEKFLFGGGTSKKVVRKPEV